VQGFGANEALHFRTTTVWAQLLLEAWTVSSIPRLTKTLHQSYNEGMVNHEVVCYPSMANTTVMHANSLPPFWYG
jgi:hypothetical protein